MGAVCITVTGSSNVLLANLGLPNSHAAAYSALAGLPYVLLPLWAPMLESFRTKKSLLLIAQALIAAIFSGVAAALLFPRWLGAVVTLLIAGGFAGATLDAVTNGVYVTTLNTRRRAFFTGVQSASWSMGPLFATGVLVLLVGKLAGETGAGQRPSAPAYLHAWTTVFVVLGVLVLLLCLWHAVVLPEGSRAKAVPTAFRDLGALYRDVATTFFEKPSLWKRLGLAFTYRLGLGLITQVGPLFVLDAPARGGLGLDDSQLGALNGIATAAFVVGSLAGGWLVASRGLRRSLVPMCLALNVPNLTFLYLAWARPQSTWLIGLAFVVEKLGWGLGNVGHINYMMEQIAPGSYATAHYGFAFAVGLNLCMTVTGVTSGYLQAALGYPAFFALAVAMALPSLLFAWIAPFDHADRQREPT
jgi:PAT family beta-lactamase induction signal transducer AmpG